MPLYSGGLWEAVILMAPARSPSRMAALLFQVMGNGLADQAGVGEGEILGQHSPPARGAEFDLGHVIRLAFLK
jgi:hypothetical protein